jgi:hypothetical protein
MRSYTGQSGGSNRHPGSTGEPPDEPPARLLRRAAAHVAHIAALSGGPVAVEGMPLYMTLQALAAISETSAETNPKMHWPGQLARCILGEEKPQ